MATDAGTESAHRAPCAAPGRRRVAEPAVSRLFPGGAAGTVALTLIILLGEPVVTGRTSDVVRLLGSDVRNPHWVGVLIAHFFHGAVLFPLGFAFFAARLPGPWVVRGLIRRTIVWSAAHGMAMAMLGDGDFGYNTRGLTTAAISLAGHWVYGGWQGLIVGIPGRRSLRLRPDSEAVRQTGARPNRAAGCPTRKAPTS